MVKIRMLTYPIIALITLAGVIFSAFHGFLSSYPYVLYLVIIAILGIFITSIIVYIKYRNLHNH